MIAKLKIIQSILLSKIKKQPYKLNFAITSACNSRCKTCRVWSEFKKNPKTTESDLTIEEIEKIFKNLSKNFIWLSLSGGEPFLRQDIVEVCKKATEGIQSLCLISIPSNGLLEDVILKRVKEILNLPIKNLFLNFSLDGPERIHDQIRGIRGAYQRTWSTYKKVFNFSKKNPRLAVNIETTISKYNLKYLENFFRELIINGHKITVTIAHTGYLYRNIKTSKNFTQLNYNGKELEKIISIVKKSLSLTSPTDIIERIYLDKILQFYKYPQKQPLPCIALSSSLALDSKGNITPCFMWGKILGNIRDYNYDLKKFQKSNKKNLIFTRNLIKKGLCPNCWTPCEAYQSIINSFFQIPIF